MSNGNRINFSAALKSVVVWQKILVLLIYDTCSHLLPVSSEVHIPLFFFIHATAKTKKPYQTQGEQ